MKDDKTILIPDEFIPDYTLTEEERHKKFDDYCNNVVEKLEELQKG
ncbi:hypothetical protein [uncultured Parvimonas sp.]|nr:hypothetical protein [uncultured Parvimonas sp.]